MTLSVTGPSIEDRRLDVPLRQGRGRATLTLQERAQEADPRVRLQLEVQDALREDNRYDTLLRDDRSVRVLLVNGDPHPTGDRDELRYLARALSLSPPEVLRCRLQTVDAASLAHVNLAPLHVIVLANVTAPSASVVARLRAFVERGGGLIVGAGRHVSPRAYNAALEGLLGAHIGASQKTPAVGLQAGPDPSLLPHGLTGLEQARTSRRLVVDGSAEAALRFADGAPAVLRHPVGRGAVVLVTTSLDADWNDMPLRPGFLALASGLVRLAASDHSQLQPPKAPGGPMSLPVPPGAEVLEVLDPDDIRHRFALQGEDRGRVELSDTAIAGAYRVSVASDSGLPAFSPELSFVVPPPAQEADLRAGTGEEAAGDTGDTPATATSAAAHTTEVRRPLTRFVLLLAALLGLLETALRALQLRRRNAAIS